MVARLALSALALLGALQGCEPRLTAGEWSCEVDAAVQRGALTDPIPVPWETGFEDRFCDYTRSNGVCLGGNDSFIVTEPVHSGRYAAAFRVDTDSPSTRQSRCFSQGELPTSGYYGAWYFIPAASDTFGNLWNLWHFQGGNQTSSLHSLLDVTLVNGANGALELLAYSELAGRTFRSSPPVPIPIGEWFHIELLLKRAADASGQFALYQDGRLLLEATDLVTDDTSFGQWYVGNLATGLTPSVSTLYVDDISIRAAE